MRLFGRKKDKLEAPPPPPELEDSVTLPSLEKLSFLSKAKPKEETSELPLFPDENEELPPFPEESVKSTSESSEELPQFPGEIESELAEIEPRVRLKSLSEILPPKIKPSSIIKEADEIEEEAMRDEKKLIHAREQIIVEKPLFVDGKNFCGILGSISEIRLLLTENEEHLGHWSQEETNKDVHLEHFKISLEQIQRKLIYIDKTLFE